MHIQSRPQVVKKKVSVKLVLVPLELSFRTPLETLVGGPSTFLPLSSPLIFFFSISIHLFFFFFSPHTHSLDLLLTLSWSFSFLFVVFLFPLTPSCSSPLHRKIRRFCPLPADKLISPYATLPTTTTATTTPPHLPLLRPEVIVHVSRLILSLISVPVISVLDYYCSGVPYC